MARIKAYYLGPLGGGDYHLYNPDTRLCYLASLRGKLKKGMRKRTSLRPGQWLLIEPLAGARRWRIMEKTGTYSAEVQPLDTHECHYAEC